MNEPSAIHLRDLVQQCATINDQLLETPANQEVSTPGITTDQLIKASSGHLQARLHEEYLGLGPLGDIIQDETITEILIRGPREIWLERRGSFVLHHDHFLSPTTFENFLMRLYAESGQHPDLNQPCGDGIWRGFRLHVITPPLSTEVQVNLRRLGGKTWTLDRLNELGWASRSAIQTIREWIATKKNFLVVGPTGSGKTSVLNACLKEISGHERVIALEDTKELTLSEGPSCQLLTRVDHQGVLREYTLSDLLKQSLRMRPQRLIVGEVRGAEARDLLMALATGHRGSLGTLHATDPRQALIRLEMLVQLGAGNWSAQAIQQLILLSLDGLMLVTERDGRRQLGGLYRITSLESCGFLLEQVA